PLIVSQAASNEGVFPMWLFSGRKTGHSQPARRLPPSRKLRLEVLEDRSLLSAGALDPSFGNGAGYVTTSLSSSSDLGWAALVPADGKIITAGEVTTSTKSYFGVARYNADGSLDTSFGTGGIAQASFGSKRLSNKISLGSSTISEL